MKAFEEAIRDGFLHITDITDPELLKLYRTEGIRVDDEGYYTHPFGEHKEYEVRIEPLGTDGQYYIALYKNGVLLTEKVPVWKRQTT